jgi:hypothetical protein
MSLDMKDTPQSSVFGKAAEWNGNAIATARNLSRCLETIQNGLRRVLGLTSDVFLWSNASGRHLPKEQ